MAGILRNGHPEQRDVGSITPTHYEEIAPHIITPFETRRKVHGVVAESAVFHGDVFSAMLREIGFNTTADVRGEAGVIRAGRTNGIGTYQYASGLGIALSATVYLRGFGSGRREYLNYIRDANDDIEEFPQDVKHAIALGLFHLLNPNIPNEYRTVEHHEFVGHAIRSKRRQIRSSFKQARNGNFAQ